MKSLFLSLIFFCLLGTNTFSQSDLVYSAEDVQNDLRFLREALIEAHYDVFTYVNQEDFEKTFNRLESEIGEDSLSFLQASNLLQQLTSAVNNGHTEIDFPGAAYGAYAYSNGTLFPLELAFEDGKSLIRKNHSRNPNIPIGAEIVSINGESIESILAKIYPQISAESIYFKNARIEMYSFPRLYWQVYGEVDKFEIELLIKRSPATYRIDAVNLITEFEENRDEILNSTMNLEEFENAYYLCP